MVVGAVINTLKKKKKRILKQLYSSLYEKQDDFIKTPKEDPPSASWRYC